MSMRFACPLCVQTNVKAQAFLRLHPYFLFALGAAGEGEEGECVVRERKYERRRVIGSKPQRG